MANVPWGLMAEGASHDASRKSANVGAITSYIQNKRRMDAQLKALGAASKQSSALYDELSAMYDPYTAQGQEAWQKLMTEYEGLKGMEYDEFTPDQVNKWLDPSLDYQMEKAGRALGARQAGTGDYLSTAGAGQLMEQSRKMGEAGWTGARDFAYQDYINKINQNRQDLSNRLNLLQNISNTGYSATGAQAGYKETGGLQGIQYGLGKGYISGEKSGLLPGLFGSIGMSFLDQAGADLQSIGNYMGTKGTYTPQQKPAQPQAIPAQAQPLPAQTQPASSTGWTMPYSNTGLTAGNYNTGVTAGGYNSSLGNQLGSGMPQQNFDLGSIGSSSGYSTAMFGGLG